MEKISVLPQSLFKFECDSELIAKILNTVKEEDWERNSTNYKTKNNSLHKEKSYKKITKWLNNCLEELKLELNFQCDSLKIVQMWANKSEIGQWHHPHTHSNSFVSGILYLNESNSRTWFSIKNIWSYQTENIVNNFKVNYGDNNQIVLHKQKSIPGNLILFPSSLYHSVDEHNFGDTERYTLSFNAFPCGKIGNFSYLSGLEIEIL